MAVVGRRRVSPRTSTPRSPLGRTRTRHSRPGRCRARRTPPARSGAACPRTRESAGPVDRAGPPGDEQAEQPGGEHGGQADRGELDRHPAGAGDALVPGQTERTGLQLAGDQRRSPEQAGRRPGGRTARPLSGARRWLPSGPAGSPGERAGRGWRPARPGSAAAGVGPTRPAMCPAGMLSVQSASAQRLRLRLPSPRACMTAVMASSFSSSPRCLWRRRKTSGHGTDFGAACGPQVPGPGSVPGTTRARTGPRGVVTRVFR